MFEELSGQNWILVAAGFHNDGGMDKANAALADYLLRCGAIVHLVSHRVDEALFDAANVRIHIVPKIANSFFLAEMVLRRRARSLAKRMPFSRVVANGGNFDWPDINWVHAFHRKWPVFDPGAPTWFKIKARLDKYSAIRNETKAISKAKIVIVNSDRTRRDLVSTLHLPPGKVHTVYLGNDPRWQLVSAAERDTARQHLGIDREQSVALFVGAMGYDQNKGFDIICKAWQLLSDRDQWHGVLIVAGSGRALDRWRTRVDQLCLNRTIQFVGFTNRIYDLLAATDLLISPVRYESYGLNVHEALCRGVPAIVSKTAGVAERYPAELSELLLPIADDHQDLARRIINWSERRSDFKRLLLPFSRALRDFTWTDMARDIVDLAKFA